MIRASHAISGERVHVGCPHETELGVTIRISNVRDAETLAELEPGGPFARLLGS